MERGAAARQRHASWLSRALRTPELFPRIPTRLVSRGGYDPVTSRPGGREWADAWWAEALAAADLDIAS